jgi:hypothetical protein
MQENPRGAPRDAAAAWLAPVDLSAAGESGGLPAFEVMSVVLRFGGCRVE